MTARSDETTAVDAEAVDVIRMTLNRWVVRGPVVQRMNASVVVDALRAAGYEVINTRSHPDHGQCPTCGKWFDRRPVTSSPEMGAHSHD